MLYDASIEALIRPEQRAVLERAEPWPHDALCAEIARLSYVRFEETAAQAARLAQALAALGFTRSRFFHDPRDVPARLQLDAEGLCALADDGRAIIAFRGTQPDSFRDIANDAAFLPIRWRGPGLVHRGFLASLESVMPQIDAWLTEIASAGVAIRHLTITGHSLGGALASLLAALKPEADLVTFGSPRVGNAAFAEAFAGRAMRRYVDCTDAVTLVPPGPYFVHLDGLRYIDRTGQVHERALGTVAGTLDRALAGARYALLRQPSKVPLRSLADHAPINYVSAVLGEREGP
jgi:hypothetical protein